MLMGSGDCIFRQEGRNDRGGGLAPCPMQGTCSYHHSWKKDASLAASLRQGEVDDALLFGLQG